VQRVPDRQHACDRESRGMHGGERSILGGECLAPDVQEDASCRADY
jgi:hypothetical protein